MGLFLGGQSVASRHGPSGPSFAGSPPLMRTRLDLEQPNSAANVHKD